MMTQQPPSACCDLPHNGPHMKQMGRAGSQGDAKSETGRSDLKGSILGGSTPTGAAGMAVAPPTPTYLWIGCADSRLVPNQITGLPAGDIFIHRNVGNVVKSSDPNCMSTLEYAINCLKVKHIIVCGHYSCSAVQAAMKMQSVQLPGLLNFWIADIREAQNTHSDELKGLSGSQQLSRLCELNVIRQAFNVCTSPVVQAAWTKGQYLHIHAMIFDTKTGLLTRLAGPITAPVMDDAKDGSHAGSPKCAPSPAPSECSSSIAPSSARHSRGSNRKKRSPAHIPKAVLAACKDSAEVEALHAMSRYLEGCGCVPDVENLLGLGAKLGSRDDLASTSKGLKELEEKYNQLMKELDELKAAKNMAEDAQEHLTQQAQWLMKEKSELVQRMGQREQLIHNLQERLDYVQAECQQLKGGSPDALLEQLTQMAATDPANLTPEMVAEMRILTSIASGELAREVANSVSNGNFPSPGPYPTPDAPPSTPVPDAEDSIPAGQTLFARFLEDDQAVRSAAAAILARADSAGPSQPDIRLSIPPSEIGTRSVTSVGLGEYHYLTVDDADRPSIRCPWTPTSSNTGSNKGSDVVKRDLHTALIAASKVVSEANLEGLINAQAQAHGVQVKGQEDFAFDFQWDKGSVQSEALGSTASVDGKSKGGSAAGTSAAAGKQGVLTVSDLPQLPALKLPDPSAMSPMSVQSAQAGGTKVPALATLQEADATRSQAPDAMAAPLTQRSSVPNSALASGYTTPAHGGTEVGFGDDTWCGLPGTPEGPQLQVLKVSSPSAMKGRRRNVLQTFCDFVSDRLHQCGADRWGPPLMQHAARPAAVVLVALLWLAVPVPGQKRRQHKLQGEEVPATVPAKEAAAEAAPIIADTPAADLVALPTQETTSPPEPLPLDILPAADATPNPSTPDQVPTPARESAIAASLSPWDSLQAGAVDLVEQMEKKFDQRMEVERLARPARTLKDADLPAVESWLLQNGWDARWGCVDGLGGDGKVCVLRSARG